MKVAVLVPCYNEEAAIAKVVKDFRAAIASQRQLLAAYPDSPKAPDALLNIASGQLELGDAASSRRTLEELIAKHPQSEAAAKARQRLAVR